MPKQETALVFNSRWWHLGLGKHHLPLPSTGRRYLAVVVNCVVYLHTIQCEFDSICRSRLSKWALMWPQPSPGSAEFEDNWNTHQFFNCVSETLNQHNDGWIQIACLYLVKCRKQTLVHKHSGILMLLPHQWTNSKTIDMHVFHTSVVKNVVALFFVAGDVGSK